MFPAAIARDIVVQRVSNSTPSFDLILLPNSTSPFPDVMSAGHNDPRLLYSVKGIKAYHLQHGEEGPLTSSGPQTLSLLMVPTSSPFADLSTADPQSHAPEEDFYLHLHIPPELDLPLPATTQIYHQPPSSYLIPRWDLGPDSGAFTRIEFPPIGTGPGKVTQEDIDTFETILAQCTSFLERASPPGSKGHGQYNPAHYGPGEGYIGSGGKDQKQGHIVLVDEENGSVVGELSEGFNVVEGAGVQPGSKSMVTPFAIHPSERIDRLGRSCRATATTRRSGKPNQCQQCLRRVSSNGPTSSLQRLDHCTECSSCISAPRHWVQYACGCSTVWSGLVHSKDQAKSKTYDFHAGYEGQGKKD